MNQKNPALKLTTVALLVLSGFLSNQSFADSTDTSKKVVPAATEKGVTKQNKQETAAKPAENSGDELGTEAFSRSQNKIGIGFGIFTEPAPSIFGFTVAYNLNEHLRLTGGYSSISATGIGSDLKPFTFSLSTFGVDAKYFPLTWTFTPFVSAGASLVTGTITGNGTVSGLGSFSKTGAAFNLGAGIDWQTHVGFDFGLELKEIFVGGQSVALPGIYMGWYF